MIILILLLCNSLFADITYSTSPLEGDQSVSLEKDEVIKKTLPGEDQLVPRFKINHKDLDKFARKTLPKIKNIDSSTTTNNSNEPLSQTVHNSMSGVSKRKKKLPRIAPSSLSKTFIENARFFSITKVQPTYVLPAGSTAMITLMGGIELSAHSKTIDTRIDWAFLGPNKSVVDMKGCRLFLNLTPEFTNERIEGAGEKLICRSSNGNVLEFQVKGFVKDAKDEYRGIKAKLLIPGKAKAAALSFLKNGLGLLGKGLQTANTSSTAITGVNSPTVNNSNVSGSKSAYVTGSLIEGAASNDAMDWYIKFLMNLGPKLGVPPGTKIFFVLEESIKVQRSFFEDNRRIR